MHKGDLFFERVALGDLFGSMIMFDMLLATPTTASLGNASLRPCPRPHALRYRTRRAPPSRRTRSTVECLEPICPGIGGALFN